MVLQLQYFSDLHLEFFDINALPIIKATAPILCLCGDIGYPDSKIYSKFLIELHNNPEFEKIFIIAGNHEYYNEDMSINEINEKIKKIISDNNLSKISFLNNSCEKYKNYLFIGSVLWSYISRPQFLTNDFNKICDMTVEKYNSLHKESVDYLKNQIENNKNENIIILTHFLPSYTLIDEKYNSYSKYNQCFASNNDDLIKSPIKLWIYGHTHLPKESIINGIPINCNPIGYKNENKKIDYEKIFEIV